MDRIPNARVITGPDDPNFDELCQELSSQAEALELSGEWPAKQLSLCGQFGVHEWFLPQKAGGQNWSEADLVRGYLRLSAACMTTTFILTQRVGACRRIAGSENESLSARLLPELVRGSTFATVGISHLTTSRRHLARPAMRAVADGQSFVLSGFSPWVTGAIHADTIVLGASLDDGRQILVALPTNLPGVEAKPPMDLVALSASCTGEIHCLDVRVDPSLLLAGPVENVMSHGIGAGTGGLQTSTLAAGLAAAAVGFLQKQAQQRPDLSGPAESLRMEQSELVDDLMAAAAQTGTCSADQIRTRANSLVLRATQAALGAAKGTGFVKGHPAGRWCREALFFLVWSCPPAVIDANLCELAGITD